MDGGPDRAGAPRTSDGKRPDAVCHPRPGRSHAGPERRGGGPGPHRTMAAGGASTPPHPRAGAAAPRRPPPDRHQPRHDEMPPEAQSRHRMRTVEAAACRSLAFGRGPGRAAGRPEGAHPRQAAPPRPAPVAARRPPRSPAHRPDRAALPHERRPAAIAGAARLHVPSRRAVAVEARRRRHLRIAEARAAGAEPRPVPLLELEPISLLSAPGLFLRLGRVDPLPPRLASPGGPWPDTNAAATSRRPVGNADGW